MFGSEEFEAGSQIEQKQEGKDVAGAEEQAREQAASSALLGVEKKVLARIKPKKVIEPQPPETAGPIERVKFAKEQFVKRETEKQEGYEAKEKLRNFEKDLTEVAKLKTIQELGELFFAKGMGKEGQSALEALTLLQEASKKRDYEQRDAERLRVQAHGKLVDVSYGLLRLSPAELKKVGAKHFLQEAVDRTGDYLDQTLKFKKKITEIEELEQT